MRRRTRQAGAVETELDLVGAYDPFQPARQRRHELAGLATRQHGVVARRQLASIGFSPEEIKGMLAARRLQRIHRGVYAVGHCALTPRSHWMAAVLACGPRALLSHRSAAALWGIRRTSQTRVEVTVPTDRGRDINGVRTYVSQSLEPRDRTTVDGIPCTSLALTLLNLAAVTDRRQTERACDEAEVQRLFDLRAIDELLARSRGHRGTARLRAVLDEHAIGTTLTRSELEERTLALCRRAALPIPAVNAAVPCGPGVWHTVDFLWPAHRVILETDGYRYHRTRSAIERDRRKEADLVTAGHRVLRSTWRQVEREPERIGRMLRVALTV